MTFKNNKKFIIHTVVILIKQKKFVKLYFKIFKNFFQNMKENGNQLMKLNLEINSP